MTPDDLRAALERVAAAAARVGQLPDEAEAGPPAGPVFVPADERASGVIADWVTPVAQRWAPQLGLEPRQLGRALAQGLVDDRDIVAVEVAPSGLLSVTVSDAARAGILAVVAGAPDSYAMPPGLRYDGDRRAEETTPDGLPAWLGDDPALRPSQRAHARLARLSRNARAAGVETRPKDRVEELTHVVERRLLVAIADLPQRLARHVGDRQQQVRAVTDLAALADAWQQPLRPEVADEQVKPIHGARLALADAARTVLRNGLVRLGASAPERM